MWNGGLSTGLEWKVYSGMTASPLTPALMKAPAPAMMKAPSQLDLPVAMVTAFVIMWPVFWALLVARVRFGARALESKLVNKTPTAMVAMAISTAIRTKRPLP